MPQSKVHLSLLGMGLESSQITLDARKRLLESHIILLSPRAKIIKGRVKRLLSNERSPAVTITADPDSTAVVEELIRSVESISESIVRVAYPVLGEPLFYSSFGRVLQLFHEANLQFEMNMIPGITTFQYILSRTHKVITQNDRLCVITPYIPRSDFQNLTRVFDVICVYKASTAINSILIALKEVVEKDNSRSFTVLIHKNIALEDEHISLIEISEDSALHTDQTVFTDSYFVTLVVYTHRVISSLDTLAD